MALAPWDVLGGGKFKSKKEIDERKKKGEKLRSLHGSEQTDDQARISEALSKVAAEHGIGSVTAVALAYAMSKTTNVFPLVGGRRVEHLQDNIQALSIKLTTAQIEYLESIKPLDVGFPNNFIGADPRSTGISPPLTAISAKLSYVPFPKPIGHE